KIKYLITAFFRKLPEFLYCGIMVNNGQKKTNKSSVRVIDLFCGIGGLTHGFIKEKFHVVAGIDIDETCKYPFEINNNSKFISKSVSELCSDEVSQLFGDASVKILVGCAPCQPFSSYTFRDKEKENNKWRLLYDFA